jgi:hypothetical protein
LLSCLNVYVTHGRCKIKARLRARALKSSRRLL